MRTEIGSNLRNVPRGMRSFLISFAVLLAAFSPLTIFTISAQALPLTDDLLAGKQPQSGPETDVIEPQKMQLTPGIPQSTTAGDIRLDGAKLTWTPTGVDDRQDTYDVAVSRYSVTDATDVLIGELAASADDSLIADLDISGLGAGTYYWQVRSCMITEACNDWSPVWTVNVDGEAPVMPIAAVTSGIYDKNVVMGGSAEHDSKVTVRVDDTACETITGADGIWTCAFAGALDYGMYEATVTSRDAAGNETVLTFSFSVKELFVAPQITTQELPPVLEIIPVNENPENKVFQQPISVVDSPNIAMSKDAEQNVLGAAASKITTDGGIVQASESGWQVVGLPWFVWLGGLSGVLASWWAFGGPTPRRLGSMLSL